MSTRNAVHVRAAEIAARNRPFIDPADAARAKALMQFYPTWSRALLGRVPDRHPRFGHPVVTDDEFALILAADELDYWPDQPNPDTPEQT